MLQDLLPGLAELFAETAACTQARVTRHASAPARAVAEVSGCIPIELTLREGATAIVGQGLIWHAEPDDEA